MTLPLDLGQLPLPDWMPHWLATMLLIVAVLYALMLIALPFSTFGVKARIEGVERQLDEISAELVRISRALGGEMLPEPERPRRSEPRLDWRRE